MESNLFTNLCLQSMEISRDTWSMCGLPIGHDGPHEAVPTPSSRVEEPAGETVGDETEALLREARDFVWMLKDGPAKGNLAPALGYIEKLAARVAGLEAREASLQKALEKIANPDDVLYGYANTLVEIAREALKEDS